MTSATGLCTEAIAERGAFKFLLLRWHHQSLMYAELTAFPLRFLTASRIIALPIRCFYVSAALMREGYTVPLGCPYAGPYDRIRALRKRRCKDSCSY